MISHAHRIRQLFDAFALSFQLLLQGGVFLQQWFCDLLQLLPNVEFFVFLLHEFLSHAFFL